MKQEIFIIVSHSFSPVTGQSTHIKNWASEGHWSSDEQIEVATRVKNKHIESASMIIDVMGMKYLKNRLASDPEVTQEDMTNAMVYYIEQCKPQIQAILEGVKNV